MSLELKMILGIGGILLLVILVYLIFVGKSHTGHMWNHARLEAEMVANVTEKAIREEMAENRSEDIQALLTDIGRIPNLERIRVVDPNGKIIFSNKTEEAGQILAQREWSREDMLPKTTLNYREQVVQVYYPILNGSTCYSCHPQNRKTLGFVDINLSFPSILAEIADFSGWSIIFPATLALVASGGLMAIYFTLVVDRRMHTISQTMSRVEAGDLTVKVPENTQDELGQFGKSFNSMVARIAEAQQQLEDRHAEELRRADNLASLGTMAAGIAHEINNPLAGMENCVKTLLKGGGENAKRVQYLKMVQEGLGRIDHTIGQLLNFAREAKPRITETHLTPLIRRCLALLEHDLVTRKISCSVSTDSELPVLLADPNQLGQVFVNILKNALEAMPHGGRLKVTAGVQHNDGAGDYVNVSITDTGDGISPEDLPRVFDPFFTTKGVGEGTGLGLSVSYGIVRAHGGSIEVQSNGGKGTTFTVVLPVSVRKVRDKDAPTDPGRRG